MLEKELHSLQEIIILLNSLHFLGSDIETIYYINKQLKNLLTILYKLNENLKNPKIEINNEDKKE